MRMKNILLLMFSICSTFTYSQNMTDISLFMRSDSSIQLSEIHSESGDLYKELGHHGPAIENEYLGLRIYFSEKAAIDVYSKSKLGLELRKAQWYPTPEQQKAGWGADYYKVGATVGLGGIRLWDGENVLPLNPVSMRTAKVVKEGAFSYMEMLSEDVPYKDKNVDILVRVTVYSGVRNAKVEAFALSDVDVQFATGINYHPGQELVEKDNYIISWGVHPEDVAADIVALGAAIIFDTDDFSQQIDDGNQILLISKQAKLMDFWISTANAREPELNTLTRFEKYISGL